MRLKILWLLGGASLRSCVDPIITACSPLLRWATFRLTTSTAYSMAISVVKAEFISLFLQTFVYGECYSLYHVVPLLIALLGIFFPLCVITIILLLRVRQGTNTERTLLPVAALMLVIATTVRGSLVYLTFSC